MLDQIPAKARAQLAEATWFVRRNQTDLGFEVNRVSRALAHIDTPVILLKGAAYLFAGLPPRHTHFAYDLDILVPRRHLERVEQALRTAGWRVAIVRPMTIATIASGCTRSRLYGILTGCSPSMSITRSCRRPAATSRTPRRSLPPPCRCARDRCGCCPADMVLHAAAHLFTEEFISGLRQLAVAHDLLEHFGRQDQFWDELLERARRHGLERILFYLVRYSGRAFATAIPAQIATAVEASPERPGAAIMDAAVMSALQPVYLTSRARAAASPSGCSICAPIG